MAIEDAVRRVNLDTYEKVNRNLYGARVKTLSYIAQVTDQYVPYQTGELASSVKIDGYSSMISYTAPYASYAFDPYTAKGQPKKYNQSTHRNACGYPLSVSLVEHEEEFAEVFRRELMKGVE